MVRLLLSAAERGESLDSLFSRNRAFRRRTRRSALRAYLRYEKSLQLGLDGDVAAAEREEDEEDEAEMAAGMGMGMGVEAPLEGEAMPSPNGHGSTVLT